MLSKKIGSSIVFCLLLASIGFAQTEEQSVKPGINDSWKGEATEPLVDRLERDGREIYAHRDELAELIDLKPGMSVADIGAGSGFMSLIFAEKVTDAGLVYAVDINAKMMERLSGQARERGLSQLKTVVCGERTVDLPSRSVDLIFICDTYHHFEYPKTTMASIYEALRPGGQLIVVDFKRVPGQSDDWILDHVRAGKEVFAEEIKNSGFKLIEDLEPAFLDENYVLRFEKSGKDR